MAYKSGSRRLSSPTASRTCKPDSSIPSRLPWPQSFMILWGKRSDQTGERVWHTSLPLMLTAVSLASALVFHSLFSIIIILCMAVIGIYAGKGPVWALSAEWLSAGTAAAGLAQINAISNLAGFGTTYILGFIRDRTGSYPLAVLPLAALSMAGALAILLIARGQAKQRHFGSLCSSRLPMTQLLANMGKGNQEK